MKKSANKQQSAITAVLIGTAIGMGVLLSLICVLAAMILGQTLPEESAGFGILICLFISVFMGSLTASLLAQGNSIVTFGPGGGILALLMLGHFLLTPGNFNNVLGTVLATACGSSLAILVSNAKKGRAYKRVKKYRFG